AIMDTITEIHKQQVRILKRLSDLEFETINNQEKQQLQHESLTNRMERLPQQIPTQDLAPQFVNINTEINSLTQQVKEMNTHPTTPDMTALIPLANAVEDVVAKITQMEDKVANQIPVAISTPATHPP